MRYTMHKWFWAWDFEKQEKWLNGMSTKGFELVTVGIGKYVFETSNFEYTYRLELLKNATSNPESISYIRFLEETGIEHVCSLTRWVYFRRQVSDGTFELYSDYESKIKHYKRINASFLIAILCSVWATFINMSSYIESQYLLAFFSSILTFSISLLAGLGIFKVSTKIRVLNKEKSIRE